MKKLLRILAVISLASVLAACGDVSTPNEETTFDFDWHAENPFYGETLTVATAFNFNIRRFAQAYMQANPGVTIELIDYSRDAARREEGREEIGLQLMTGDAPIMFADFFVNYLNADVARMLADWRPIMNSDPNFIEEDWFMAPFDAMAVDGRLLSFPFEIRYTLLSANTTIPGMTEALEGRTGITYAEALQIYLDLGGPEMGMFMDDNFNVNQAVQLNLSQFLDIPTRHVDFVNDEFIDLITTARRHTDPANNFDWVMSDVVDLRQIEEDSRHYFFRRDNVLNMSIYNIFETENPFGITLPFVNAHGEVMIIPFQGFVLNAGATPAQQALAMDFIRFMMIVPPLDPNLPDDAQDPQIVGRRGLQHGMWLMLPLHRSFLEFSVGNNHQSLIRWNFTWGNGWRLRDGMRLVEEWHLLSEIILEPMQAWGDMPMARSNTAPGFVVDAIEEILRQFHDGLITAEAAANDLQNRITLILMEMS